MREIKTVKIVTRYNQVYYVMTKSQRINVSGPSADSSSRKTVLTAIQDFRA